MKCYYCGVEPLEVYETTTWADPAPTFIPGRWPPAEGHEHAVRPPSPRELADAGERALTVIREQLL